MFALNSHHYSQYSLGGSISQGPLSSFQLYFTQSNPPIHPLQAHYLYPVRSKDLTHVYLISLTVNQRLCNHGPPLDHNSQVSCPVEVRSETNKRLLNIIWLDDGPLDQGNLNTQSSIFWHQRFCNCICNVKITLDSSSAQMWTSISERYISIKCFKDGRGGLWSKFSVCLRPVVEQHFDLSLCGTFWLLTNGGNLARAKKLQWLLGKLVGAGLV